MSKKPECSLLKKHAKNDYRLQKTEEKKGKDAAGRPADADARPNCITMHFHKPAFLMIGLPNHDETTLIFFLSQPQGQCTLHLLCHFKAFSRKKVIPPKHPKPILGTLIFPRMESGSLCLKRLGALVNS